MALMPEKDNREFFVVIRDDDVRYKRHEARIAATDEARRLAGKEPGHFFFVCRAEQAAYALQPAIMFLTTRRGDDNGRS